MSLWNTTWPPRRPLALRYVVLGMAAALALGGLGCGKGCGSDSEASGPAPPAALAAVLSLPKGGDLGPVAERIGAFAPGASAAVGLGVGTMAREVAGMLVTDANALDLQGPIHVIVVGHPETPAGLALLAKFRTAPTPSDGLVTEAIGELTLIAASGQIDGIKEYARWLEGMDADAPPRVRIAPKRAVEVFKAEIEMMKYQFNQGLKSGPTGMDLSAIFKMYGDMGSALVEQADWVDLRMHGGDQPLMELVIAPRAGTTLADFAALQKPHEFNLQKRLPAMDTPTVYFEGTLFMGELMTAMLDMMRVWMPQFDQVDDYKEAMKEIGDAMTGEFVAAMRFTGADLLQGSSPSTYEMVFAAPTTRSTDAAIRKMWTSMSRQPSVEVMGIEQRSTYREDVKRIRDTPVHEVAIDSTIPMGEGAEPMKMHQTMQYAGSADWLLVAQTVGDNPVDLAPLDQAARGEGTSLSLSDRLRGVLVRAKEAEDSLAMAIDVAAFAPPGVPMPFEVMSMLFGVRGSGDQKHIHFGIDLR